MKSHFLFLLLIACTAKSQNIKTAIIQVDTSLHGETFAIPYSDIKVIDARFDQTKIGCSYNSVFLGSLSLEKYDTKFPEAFSIYFPKLLNTFIKTDVSSKDQLIVLVKQFRVADHLQRVIEVDPVEMS